MKSRLYSRLAAWNQQHVLAFWHELESAGRQRLADQIEKLDLAMLEGLFRAQDEAIDWGDMARRAGPPPAIRRVGASAWTEAEARDCGEAELRAGRVGMILVAGGQGTRLGFPRPKGLLAIGPVSQRTLFEIVIDHLRAVARRYGVTIPLYLMTSPATHDETLEFLRQHDGFGLPRDGWRLFCQGTMPALDAKTGQLLLAGKGELALSPDGHGGMLRALAGTACLDDARGRGVDHFFYGQIDNPLLQVCDPLFIGHHMLARSELTTQVIEKRDALERVGNVVAIDGKVQIIEYSDLPSDVAHQRNPDGSLLLWAGNLAVHVFARTLLERVASEGDALPFHRALKRVSYVDASGCRVDPVEPNALKFERFIFDLLPLARTALVVEVNPAEAFAPIKNNDEAGRDSPNTAREAMVALHRRWLEAAGARVAPHVAVEINPLWALDARETAERCHPGQEILESTYFVPDSEQKQREH